MNADNYVSTGLGILGYNMYNYGNNNPISNSDPEGHFITLGMLGVLAVSSAVIIGNALYQYAKSKKEINKVQKQKAPDKTQKLNNKLKSSADELKRETAGQNSAKKLNTFIKAVKSGSKYDLKRQEEWKETISYNGMIMEPQDIGNLHFGYIGRALGYDIEFLTMGAGAYQLYEHSFQLETYKNCLTPSLCDDPRDNYYIRLGAIIYDQEN